MLQVRMKLQENTFAYTPEKLSYFLHMVIALLLATGWLEREREGREGRSADDFESS